MDLIVQHVHMCLWPHLVSPFLKLATPTSDPAAAPPRPRPARLVREEEKGAGLPRVEVNVEMNNISLALVEKPSNKLSYGVCAEVRSLALALA